METLKLKAIQKARTKDNSRIVRIDAEIYDTISYITLRTGIPMTQITDRLLDLALRNTEIEGAEELANLLEAYKQSDSKFN